MAMVLVIVLCSSINIAYCSTYKWIKNQTELAILVL